MVYLGLIHCDYLGSTRYTLDFSCLVSLLQQKSSMLFFAEIRFWRNAIKEIVSCLRICSCMF